MTLLLQGNSYRTIQARCGATHATIAKGRKALNRHNITTEAQVLGYSTDELFALIDDGRTTTSDEYVPIDFATAITVRIGRKKIPFNVLWATYLNQPTAPGRRHCSYERFRQLINRNIQAQGLTTRVHHVPGHTCQGDWARTKMQIVDPIAKKTTKVSIFWQPCRIPD